jgi:Zn-dependent peptidase ImmA (M78 family)
VEDILNKFHFILKSPETQRKIKKKYDVKDIIKFKKLIYNLIDKHEQQKFIKNKNCKCLYLLSDSVSVRDLQIKQFMAHLNDNNVNKEEEEMMQFLQ